MFRKILLFVAYLYAAALFTSMAALSLFQALAAVICLGLLIIGLKNKSLYFHKSQIFLFLYLFISVISFVISGRGYLAFAESGTLIRFFLGGTLVLFIKACEEQKFSAKDLRHLLIVFVISTSLAHFSGIIGYFTSFNPLKFKNVNDITRASGMYGMGITYGNSCQFLLLFFAALLIQYEKISHIISRKWLVWGTVVTAIGLAFSLTRGAWVGTFLALPFLFLQRSKTIFIKWTSFAFGSLAILLVVSLTIPRTNRLSFYSESNRIRISQLQVAWEAFKEQPILGIGLNQFPKEVERIKIRHDIPFKEFKGSAHNIFFEALACNGFFGFLCIFLFFVFWLRESIQMNHFLKPMLLATWVALVVSGVFQNNFTDAENMYLIFFIYALGLWATDKVNAKAKAKETGSVHPERAGLAYGSN